jgi:hypothetical protein
MSGPATFSRTITVKEPVYSEAGEEVAESWSVTTENEDLELTETPTGEEIVEEDTGTGLFKTSDEESTAKWTWSKTIKFPWTDKKAGKVVWHRIDFGADKGHPIDGCAALSGKPHMNIYVYTGPTKSGAWTMKEDWHIGKSGKGWCKWVVYQSKKPTPYCQEVDVCGAGIAGIGGIVVAASVYLSRSAAEVLAVIVENWWRVAVMFI